MDKQQDAMAILKLYELRREEKMRQARAWFFSDFTPKTTMDIIKLYRDGEQASAYFRTVVSYWDMAASLVLNGAVDEKTFNDANGEHMFVYAKIAPFLPEIRQLFNEPEFFGHLETLVMRIPNIETKLENRRRLFALWSKEEEETAAEKNG